MKPYVQKLHTLVWFCVSGLRYMSLPRTTVHNVPAEEMMRKTESLSRLRSQRAMSTTADILPPPT
jgi:hypothetical protein